MVKKKRNHPDIEEILARPWCYYCERDFDDMKILVSHQKAKHYKCDRCNRRLNTAGGLSVHMNQVHKENLTTVENALPNRQAPDIEIFGMEGIPEDVMQAHNQRISHEFFAAEAERRALNGNHAPQGGSGNQGGQGVKKQKFEESPADLKKKLAEHRAKKKALAEAGGDVSSEVNTPGETASTPIHGDPQQAPMAGALTPAAPDQMAFHQAPTGPPAQLGFPQPYSHSPVNASPTVPPYYGAPPQPAWGSYAGAPAGPPFPAGPPPGAFPAGPLPGAFPPGQFPPQPHFSPMPQQHYGAMPQPQHGEHAMYPHQYSQYPPAPTAANMAPQSRQFVHSHQQPPGHAHHQPPVGSTSPVQAAPSRQSSLPAAPGLPQRPSFNAPHVSREQLAEMHQGISVPDDAQQQSMQHHNAHQANQQANAQSIDEMISSAAQNPSRLSTAPNPGPAPASVPAEATPASEPEKTTPAEKVQSSKKARKPFRLVYNDEEISPEEKRAMLPKYKWIPPKQSTETVRGPVGEAVTGVVQDSDKVLDPSG